MSTSSKGVPVGSFILHISWLLQGSGVASWCCDESIGQYSTSEPDRTNCTSPWVDSALEMVIFLIRAFLYLAKMHENRIFLGSFLSILICINYIFYIIYLCIYLYYTYRVSHIKSDRY